LESLDDTIDSNNLPDEHVNLFKKLFLQGNIILETVGLLSVYVFNHSQACKNYIKARYTHIIIDEYQDSGNEQHLLFLKIKALELNAIAVGDANQSIFKFSGKSSEYLVDLAKRKDEFHLFPLDYNHRCHPSIINYSLLLLNSKSELLDYDDIHVYEKLVQGNEVSIAQWLTGAIINYERLYKVTKRNKIGVLVRNNRTGNLVHDNLGLPHKYFVNTSLDEDFTIWSGIFRNLFAILFDKHRSKTEFVEGYISSDNNRTRVIGVLKQINELSRMVSQSPIDIVPVMEMFERVALSLFPGGKNNKSLTLLQQVLSDSSILESYKPAAENEMQIMSLHKSKGLEFDIVFHLDLYEWILPKKEINNGEASFSDLRQDVNLHYVGITRAKKCCVLCHSSQRTNYEFKPKTGNPSEFLRGKVLQKMRKQSPC
jgi:superfamily I DNA/RNA helicase